MPTRIIRDEAGIAKLANYLGALKLPITVSIVQGEHRRDAQNALAFMWYMDISRQMGDRSPEEARAEAKVSFGIPIHRTDNTALAAVYDARLGRIPYEEQVEFVRDTELPVTSLFTVKQMARYLDAMEKHWRMIGVRLTDPMMLGREEEM